MNLQLCRSSITPSKFIVNDWRRESMRKDDFVKVKIEWANFE